MRQGTLLEDEGNFDNDSDWNDFVSSLQLTRSNLISFVNKVHQSTSRGCSQGKGVWNNFLEGNGRDALHVGTFFINL